MRFFSGIAQNGCKLLGGIKHAAQWVAPTLHKVLQTIFEHAVLKQTTPYRTPTNLQCGQQIVYTSISVCDMHAKQPYRTEADIFMLDEATTDEIYVATEGGSVYFDENGEMKFSVQDQYVLKLVGTKDFVDKCGNLELMIENCSFIQNNTLDNASNFSLLRTEPFLSLRKNISILNFNGYNASIEGTGLIEINYEPDVFTWDNHLNLVNCSFTKISSIMTVKELKEIIDEKNDEQPLGVASFLNVRRGSAKILPIYIYDCQFDQCKCSVEIPTKERRQIGVGGAIAFCVKTLLLTLKHLKLINCSINVTFAQPKLQYSINRMMNRNENESNPIK
ncbi:MAG: hypothetical protein EZS28_008109 [Streblomastix strix]|uniref:Uncharacterized protein n=1 Tax=Streblomastix strix TaxID=222440 RepID=A0A5J4WNI2_9EUKA|nr:MAG: hypothetical protein EZS28_008109 [Streblomastix strix]